MNSGQLFINNQWLAGSGALFESINPATNSTIWTGNEASKDDVDYSIKSAKKAFLTWANLSYENRKSIVKKFCNKLSENKDELAKIISQETGKPHWESKAEVASMISKIDVSISSYNQRTGNIKNKITDTSYSHLNHRPHGVLAVYGPFNFPGSLPNGHIVPALLAGNTIVFKPSENTPLVGEFIFNIWQQAQLPKGILNLVQGKKETGQFLASHRDVNGILFTGSYETGLNLHRKLSNSPEKILALELGGNNPLIIDKSIDEREAVYGIIQSAFITSGQRCTCARRIFIPQGEKGDQIIKCLLLAINKMIIGEWQDTPEPFMGPLISPIAAKHILDAQKELLNLGGFSLMLAKKLARGNSWLSPGVIDVTNIKDLPDKEYFGPLSQIIRYENFEDAVNMANKTEFGLSASLYSQNRSQFDYFCKNIQAGIINWNRQTTGALGSLPFGGVGKSGNHRPSAWYAADYCAYPVASVISETAKLPDTLAPGIIL